MDNTITSRIGGRDYEIKKGLTETEYVAIINASLDVYANGLNGEYDKLLFTRYNPIGMEQAFNRFLVITCIDDYDFNNYEEDFANNIIGRLLRDVDNAKKAWDKCQEISKDALNIGNVIDIQLTHLIKKLPEQKGLEKIMNKFTKQLNALNKKESEREAS